MPRYDPQWEPVARMIRKKVQQALNRREFQNMGRTVRSTASPDPQSETTESLYAGTTGPVLKAVGMLLGGGMLSLIGFSFSIIFMIYNAAIAGTSILDTSSLLSLCAMFGGGGICWKGGKNLGLINRFRKIRKVLGVKTQCSLQKLARSVGRPQPALLKDVQSMMKQGLFLEGHLNKEQTWLITSNETFRQFEESRLQLEQRRRQTAQAKAQEPAMDPLLQDVLTRGQNFIAQIRKCNEAIPGDEISAKIDRMESVIGRIFQRAEAHPEVIPDLKKLMDYYLPMTVKLLNAYADMDAQPVQGENIQSSKREIEGSLDTLNRAFENLLDDLFEDTALDVSSDISVLQTMLAQEGLTGSDFTPTDPTDKEN